MADDAQTSRDASQAANDVPSIATKADCHPDEGGTSRTVKDSSASRGVEWLVRSLSRLRRHRDDKHVAERHPRTKSYVPPIQNPQHDQLGEEGIFRQCKSALLLVACIVLGLSPLHAAS